jgi:hypothetical protein
MPAVAATVTGAGGVSAPAAVPSFINPISLPVTTTDISTFLQASLGPVSYQSVTQGWGGFVAISYTISFILAAWLVYSATHIRRIRKFESLAYAQKLHSVTHRDIPQTQLRWHRVKEKIMSDNEQSWRVAILEADVMLNELLDTLGYKGHTMTDKMRQAERTNFRSIDLAWEAHRVRNRVAHEGEALHLDEQMARHTIGMYEHVFKEFHFLP